MIVEFLGKGGSGKTTISHQCVAAAERSEDVERILAVDADHNMGFAKGLLPGRTFGDDFPYFGESLDELLEHFDSPEDYRDAIIGRGVVDLSNPYIKEYSCGVGEKLLVMCAGPHTEAIRNDETCSHSLFTPLKVLLPSLSLKDSELVVVDEKAGTDGAGTGISAGVDQAVVVTEPTEQGVDAAGLIISELAEHETPYVVVCNKVETPDDAEYVAGELGHDVMFAFERNPLWRRSQASGASEQISLEADKLLTWLMSQAGDQSMRHERAIGRLIRV